MRLGPSGARRVVLSSAIVAFCLAAISASAWAASPGANGRIAFASDRAGDLDIWTINPDGSGAFNVTDAAGAPAFNLEPAWSTDGTRIAFRNGRADAAEIYTVNADGTGLTQLTSNAFKDYAPTWSPDGTAIAFASNRNDPNFATCVGLYDGCIINIFVMSATGGDPIQVTSGQASEQFPQFSPDGKFIAYSSDVSGASAIYKVELETGEVTKLTPDSLLAGEPRWSPDGTRIAFSSNFYPCATGRSDCRTDVFVMNADGTSITRLTQGFRNNGSPSWSPQGDRIAFTHSNSAQFQPQQIYVMNADGSGITRLTPTRDNSFGPAWGPE